MAKKTKRQAAMDAVREELLEIKGDRPTLSAKEVVEYAKRHKSSAIHDEFARRGLWDDKKAADQARLAFGHQLIMRVKIRKVGNDNRRHNLRAAVSLVSDRKTGAGYRLRDDVLSSEEQLAEMRIMAAGDIETVVNRYADILDSAVIEQLQEIAALVSEGSLAAEHG